MATVIHTDHAIKAALDQASFRAEILDGARRYFDFGMGYFAARLDQLGLSGKRVLEIGCEGGHWSLSLAARFDQVLTLDHRAEQLEVLAYLCRRLEISRIEGKVGTVEHLPVNDQSMDVVWCHAGLRCRSLEKSLQEIHRVLKPGGTLYLTFLTGNWWPEPGHEEQGRGSIRVGCEAMVNWACYLMDRLGTLPRAYLLSCIDLELARLEGIRKQVAPSQSWMRTELGITLRQVRTVVGARPRLRGRTFRVLRLLMKLERLRVTRAAVSEAVGKDPGEELEQHLRAVVPLAQMGTNRSMAVILYDLARCCWLTMKYGGTDQRIRLWQELQRLGQGRPGSSAGVQHEPILHTRVPAEMVELLEGAGFAEIGTSWEGTLVINSDAMPVKPLCDQSLGLFETMARRSSEGRDTKAWEALDLFPRLARRAASAYAVWRGADVTLSNRKAGLTPERILDQFLRQAGPRVSAQDLVQKIVAEVRGQAGSLEDAFFRLYRFIQDSLFHHPTLQLLKQDGALEDDPAVILFSGIGRCGHVATLARDLYQAMGYQGRVTQLYKHLCAEVFDGDRWRVVDADLLKAGVFPKDPAGCWMTLAELEKNPVMLDALPGVGLVLSRKGPWMKNLLGQPCEGYVDGGLPWERPYPSYLYFGKMNRRPPAPPDIQVRRAGGYLEIIASECSPDTERIKVCVDSVSRGWTYEDYPDERYLSQPGGRLSQGTYSVTDLRQGIQVPVPEATVYLNVWALDRYMVEQPSVFSWPGPEIVA